MSTINQYLTRFFFFFFSENFFQKIEEERATRFAVQQKLKGITNNISLLLFKVGGFGLASSYDVIKEICRRHRVQIRGKFDKRETYRLV